MTTSSPKPTQPKPRLYDVYDVVWSAAEVGELLGDAILTGDPVLRLVGWQGDDARCVEVLLNCAELSDGEVLVMGRTADDDRTVNLFLHAEGTVELHVSIFTRAEITKKVAESEARRAARGDVAPAVAPAAAAPVREQRVPVSAYPVCETRRELVGLLAAALGFRSGRALRFGVVVDDERCDVEVVPYALCLNDGCWMVMGDVGEVVVNLFFGEEPDLLLPATLTPDSQA